MKARARSSRPLVGPAGLARKLLIVAPELAAIELLDRALAVAEHALLAEHPELATDRRTIRPDAAPIEHARRLLRAIRPLRRQITRYRRAVRDQILNAPSDRLPF